MDEETHPGKEQARAHPRPRYFNILIALVILTGMEVAASYIQGVIRIPILVILAGIKAALVIMYFMHLKFDPRIYSLWFLLGGFIIIPLLLVLGLVMPFLK